MLLCSAVLVLLLLQPSQSGPAPLTTAPRGSGASRAKPPQGEPPVDSNATALAVGEPCGVYTLGCGHGLRCAPPEDEPRPLRALLEGRGVCTPALGGSPTDEVPTAAPVPTEDPDEAPCRKLLTTLVNGLDAHVFKSNQDIYMPNCDKRGFFRKKQCWSSRGKQRGKCWCVDESGMPVSSSTKKRGSLRC
ncbi:insulin-like growth factor-binding protein 3 [Betta splendens]|uniref:Insulin-like growth factor-binding protein 3 n=1 Tax=Betta splendens TaxID=158456 RepID=A0A6P7MJX6_BETSP|nr:insulin-like growth factor-binding protein 3 [Betta splendens]